MWKEDVKKAKLSIEGADVQITNVVFHWKGGKNETIPNVGVLKAGATKRLRRTLQHAKQPSCR